MDICILAGQAWSEIDMIAGIPLNGGLSLGKYALLPESELRSP
jgi:hypothetical protein